MLLLSYASSISDLDMLPTLLDADFIRGIALAPSVIFSFVTSMDSILLVFVSTAIWNLMNPFLFVLYHFSLIHSPLFETFIPVESTAITTSLSISTVGSISTFTLATLHHTVV